MSQATNTATSRLDVTRQMLDELDALMAKMLDAPASPAPAAPPTIAATLTVINANESEYLADTLRVRADLPVATELGVREPHRVMTPTSQRPKPATTDPVPTSAQPQIDALLAAAPVESPRLLTRLAYLPLRGVNALFDSLTMPLGPLGSVLRTPNGRFFLGYFGLAMLLLAAIWWIRSWYWSR